MTRIRVYEAALCCNTGVCGPDTDEALVTFTADLAHLKAQGIDVARHNLANDPGAFVADPVALAFLHETGSDGLPLTVVGATAAKAGTYPSREELKELARSAPAAPTNLLPPHAQAGGCCGGSSC